MTIIVARPRVAKTDAEWKQQLTPEQYRVTRRHETERAFTGPHWNDFEKGLYRCICCREPLFQSDAKFDAGCGWPSYSRAISAEAVSEQPDASYGMIRTEIRCGSCDAHLGHVFPDGPAPTGLRYCVNGHAMSFEPAA
jgi:peptide-methionine (R)-S-oxide reductase